MEYKRKVGFLKFILGFMAFILIIRLIGILMFPHHLKEVTSSIPAIIYTLTFHAGYITIIINLMKTLSSFSSKDPFINDNVQSFRIIGYSILIMGIGDAIIRYPLPNNTGVEIIATSYGSLKPVFFLYVVLSILALILADVFKMAINIKDENDLTI